jgi:hypothetical protein
MEKCVDIIGRGNGYQNINYEAPRDIWAVSSIFKRLQYADKVFQLHAPEYWEDFIPTLSNVVTIKPYKQLPGKEFINAQGLIDKYGPIFHSSISWIIAYAVEQGYTDIGFHGIHMRHQTEYGKQRDSLFFLFGVLQSKGIKLRVPKDSGIYLSSTCYGGL